MGTDPTNLRRFTVTETREAVEVTADNLDEVAAWCGGKAYADSSLPHVMYDGQEADGPLRRMLMVGNVLVTDGTRWWDVSREEFERASEQWTETT